VRYTVMIVPEGGRGDVWQTHVALRRVRQVAAVSGTVLVGLCVLAAVQVATLPRVVAHDTLVGENLALKARLDEVDRRVAALEPLVSRVRLYDEQLRALESRQALPGFGPIDREEAAARQVWIDGVVPDVPTTGRRSGEVEAHLAALEDDLAALSSGLETFQEMLARFDSLESALPRLWPAEGVLTSPFGYRIQPITRRWTMHTGVDLGAPWGTPILAVNDGLVVFTGWDSGHGLSVIVDHGQDVTTRYYHASRLLVEDGDQVAAGDVIALVGSTGMSTGPHLHFELVIGGETVDPLEYLP
jgi:murein DD-endopeptidase MepM/ murein hydrolase activator NlpD